MGQINRWMANIITHRLSSRRALSFYGLRPRGESELSESRRAEPANQTRAPSRPFASLAAPPRALSLSLALSRGVPPKSLSFSPKSPLSTLRPKWIYGRPPRVRHAIELSDPLEPPPRLCSSFHVFAPSSRSTRYRDMVRVHTFYFQFFVTIVAVRTTCRVRDDEQSVDG